MRLSFTNASGLNTGQSRFSFLMFGISSQSVLLVLSLRLYNNFKAMYEEQLIIECCNPRKLKQKMLGRIRRSDEFSLRWNSLMPMALHENFLMKYHPAKLLILISLLICWVFLPLSGFISDIRLLQHFAFVASYPQVWPPDCQKHLGSFTF